MIANRYGGLAALVLVMAVPAARAAEPAALLKTIKAVGREGAGNPEAAKAWKQLTAEGPETLPVILAGMDDANPTASNWLRSAVDPILERAKATGKPLPTAQLEAFVKDTKHAPAPRRLAYDVLAAADKTVPERFLPTMLHDPSHELRRDAVAFAMASAKKKLDIGDKPGDRRGLSQGAVRRRRSGPGGRHRQGLETARRRGGHRRALRLRPPLASGDAV